MQLDQELKAGRKSLRTVPGGLLLGPTGARLWADYVEARPGFAGRFDFIHKVNIPLLFTVTANGREWLLDTAESEWMPSQLHLACTNDYFTYSETKFISWDDCAVSCQTWTNPGERELVLKLAVDPSFQSSGPNGMRGGFDVPHHSFDLDAVVLASEPALLHEEGWKVAPGESVSFVIAAALGIRSVDKEETLRERALHYARPGRALSSVREEQRIDYQAWFDKAPRFQCSDPLINRTWIYRWFVLRHNLSDPRYGLLQHPFFCEGRSHKKSKAPYSKGGWEFSKLINLSVPLHLSDARWYSDISACEGAIRNMQNHPDENGMYSCLMVDERMHSFANFLCWAAYRLYLVHRNESFMREALPGLKKQISSWKEVYGNDRDDLMTEYWHTRTGKEYQPSYWYFHDYPRNPKDRETYTHVKRVDRTVYHYLNVLGVARLCEAFGDPDADTYKQMAERIKKDVLELMWDNETDFFYDLHYQTDEKAFVKNIVGFYPAWAEILDERHDGLIPHLLNPAEFATRCPFPTVSADSTAYSREGGWFGQFVKGRNGCMWNGPTWPYTNSIVLDALARESRRHQHAYDEAFGRALREYSFLHFRDRDLNRPGLVEHYNSATGEPLSDEQEYNHSYYLDLVISHVAGLSVENDKLVFDPLDIGLDYFELEGVKAAGHTLRIVYGRPGHHRFPEGVEAGYRVYLDGELAYSSDRLARTELSIPKS